MAMHEAPIASDELASLFGSVWTGDRTRAALAVSGGSDSTALMVLLADWLVQTGRGTSGCVVLTVDHGLRTEAAEEAERVARHARALGFEHKTLVWSGPKPATGVQAAARRARYALLTEHMRSEALDLLLIAHTADDQAETLVMRLARGSGLDGLAGMTSLTTLDIPRPPGEAPIFLGRPLLHIGKARLRSTLEVRSIGWIEDPSNADPRFERTQLRLAHEALERTGLTRESLGLCARRLRRVRGALDAAVTTFCADQQQYHVDRCGFITIDTAKLRALPLEIVLRVLLKSIAVVGGSHEPVPLAKAESLADAIVMPDASGTWTLARATISVGCETTTIEREPGRMPLPEMTLSPGRAKLWDGRFWISAEKPADPPLAVRALGATGLGALRMEIAVSPGTPLNTLRALPGFWQRQKLVAVPSVGYCSGADIREYGLCATFAALDGSSADR